MTTITPNIEITATWYCLSTILGLCRSDLDSFAVDLQLIFQITLLSSPTFAIYSPNKDCNCTVFRDLPVCKKVSRSMVKCFKKWLENYKLKLAPHTEPQLKRLGITMVSHLNKLVTIDY